MSSETKHIYAIEMTNAQRLEMAELHTQLREDGVLPINSNLGMFMKDAFYRGLNEYRKDLHKNYV
jgi:hypothetical protein